MKNVDGNNTLVVKSDISNGRGTLRSIEEDSCTVPKEVVCMASLVYQNTETSSECGTTHASNSRPQRQSRLANGFEEANKCNLNAMWANFFYEANIPFTIAQNPAFKEAMKRTVEFNRPYSLPSYHNLRHELLN